MLNSNLLNYQQLFSEIMQLKQGNHIEAPMLVAISGIDASGKGYIGARFADSIHNAGYKVALLGIDPWQNLPHVRISQENPGEHFYHNAVRQTEMFEKLVLPLKERGSITLCAQVVEHTSEQFWLRDYRYQDIDIILLEGIFLFQSQWMPHYDCSVWIQCSEQLALQRALKRNQEGLESSELIAEYHSIYFPAQKYHQQKDNPQQLADFLLINE